MKSKDVARLVIAIELRLRDQLETFSRETGLLPFDIELNTSMDSRGFYTCRPKLRLTASENCYSIKEAKDERKA